ncbi:3-oxo-tetronate kinase [Pseudoclavibacter helvolus]|uniref:3-oxo-tetronate kinase n=1 Tax=Pseudoclavibacter helvolus TaxID=255205 RepID=UPI003C742C88
MKLSLGVIADDHTGGTDVAAALGNSGLRVLLCFDHPELPEVPAEYDAVVIALKSRMLGACEAVAAVRAANDWLRGHAEQVYFKYCSTFDSTRDGNIGPVLDLLRQEAEAAITVGTPATPQHGRTVSASTLFVDGVPLAESHMRHHPVTPMTKSDLVALLAEQSSSEVAALHLEEVRGPEEALVERIEQRRREGAMHLIADAVDEADLDAIAAATAGLPVVAGAAGFAAAIGRRLARQRATALAGASAKAAVSVAVRGRADARASVPAEAPAAVVLAGSCSTATLGQLERLKDAGHDGFRIDPRTGSAEHIAAEALAWFDAATPRADAPFFFASTSASELARIHADLGRDLAARRVEDVIGQIAVGLRDRGVRRIIAAGGETSGAVVDALDIRSARVGDEEAPGVPWIYPTSTELEVLLKSGNFGDPDLLVRAAAAAPSGAVA